MDDASRRVMEVVQDARSNDDLVDDYPEMQEEQIHPLDVETLDEIYSTQMGNMWESVRRNAND